VTVEITTSTASGSLASLEAANLTIG